MADVSKLVPFILKWEGGFQQMKEDTGNYLNGVLIGTNKGITPAAYQMTFGKVPTVQDMKNITHEQFMAVLKRFYWDRWKADTIKSQAIANTLVDWVWGSGKWGIIIPQRILGVTADGLVGPKTIEALNGYKAGTLNNHGMGAVMKGQVVKLSDADIADIAKQIAAIK